MIEILNNWRSNKSISSKDKLDLYNYAKDTYYNGSAIMEDFEFDELERELGLENKSYVGSKHNPSYTIKHPFIMGSLSKVQIHEVNNKIDWNFYFNEVCKFTKNNMLIITPKYDGCSFEVNISNNNIDSIVSRGDGEFGKDYTKHLNDKVTNTIVKCFNEDTVLRGEVLVNKSVFATKYSKDVDQENGYTNPRAFVSGVLNRDFDANDQQFIEMINDLSIVIYDVKTFENNRWVDHDWTEFKDYINNIPEFYKIISINNCNEFAGIYNEFDSYRANCSYALDGIVIKPIANNRINDLTARRPTDCVAVKFTPILQETTIRDIKWQLGKTGEYTPVIITDPVMMDGKEVKRASAHNYGNLISNKLSIGCKVILSLAGDIIPFIYKITDVSNFNETNICLPDNVEVDGLHLMAILSEDERRAKELKYSILTLNIPGMGESNANSIVEYEKICCCGNEFFDEPSKPIPNNILLIDPVDIELAIGGKNGTKTAKAYKEILANLSLELVIRSCNFKLCGPKVAEQVSNKLLDKNYDFTSMASEAYEWCFNDNSDQMKKLNNIMNTLGLSYEYFKSKSNVIDSNENNDKIPVILTGEPNNYSSKAEFIRCNPQYKVTTKWKGCQIVFTNSLESTTGKMKQAKSKNIEIRLY